MTEEIFSILFFRYKVNNRMHKLIKLAQRRMENSQYLMHQAKDRRKEVLFELRGCQ